MATDPRIDQETRQHWEGLTHQLRLAIAALDTSEQIKLALTEVVDLHVAWEKREQVYGPKGYSHDTVHGIGCRMCDYMPAAYVPVESRHCQTVEGLRVVLLADSSKLPPWDTRPEMNAWNRGWTAAKTAAPGEMPQNPYWAEAH